MQWSTERAAGSETEPRPAAQAELALCRQIFFAILASRPEEDVEERTNHRETHKHCDRVTENLHLFSVPERLEELTSFPLGSLLTRIRPYWFSRNKIRANEGVHTTLSWRRRPLQHRLDTPRSRQQGAARLHRCVTRVRQKLYVAVMVMVSSQVDPVMLGGHGREPEYHA